MAGLLLSGASDCSAPWPSQCAARLTRVPQTFRLSVCFHLALTRRADTVAWSMSGELAVILWAARTPTGNRVPPSELVPASRPLSDSNTKHRAGAMSRRTEAANPDTPPWHPPWPRRNLPAAVKPLARAKASCPAPMKPTLMSGGPAPAAFTAFCRTAANGPTEWKAKPCVGGKY